MSADSEKLNSNTIGGISWMKYCTDVKVQHSAYWVDVSIEVSLYIEGNLFERDWSRYPHSHKWRAER